MTVADKFFNIKPPNEDVFARATAITSQLYELPPSWYGKMVTFSADQAKIGINFGDSGVVASLSTNSGLATNTLTADVATADPIESGGKDSYLIPKSAASGAPTHFAVIGDVATGRWVARLSTGVGE